MSLLFFIRVRLTISSHPNEEGAIAFGSRRGGLFAI